MSIVEDKALSLHFDPGFDYDGFEGDFYGWGKEALIQLKEQPVNFYSVGAVMELTGKDEDEVEGFLDGLCRLGVASDRGTIYQKYDLSALVADNSVYSVGELERALETAGIHARLVEELPVDYENFSSNIDRRF